MQKVTINYFIFQRFVAAQAIVQPTIELLPIPRKLIAFVITLDIPTICPRNMPFCGQTHSIIPVCPQNWGFCGHPPDW